MSDFFETLDHVFKDIVVPGAQVEEAGRFIRDDIGRLPAFCDDTVDATIIRNLLSPSVNPILSPAS